jgi:hypothetical protein
MPKEARTGQSEGTEARMSTCMPNGGGTCPRERAQDKRRARVSNRWRTCPRERAHAVFPPKFGVSKGSAHVPRVAHAGQSEGVQAQGDWRERMPKGARASLVEGAQARMSACMPNEGRTCLREHAQAKRRAREPNEWRTCCFPCKIWFSKGRAHVPNGGRTSPR